MEEKKIIYLLKQGSESAFTTLYERYWRKVYNFARLYLSSVEDSQEVVQEVFIKLWEIRATIREDENLNGLLFIITRNNIFNHSRRKINEEFYQQTVAAAMEESYTEMEEKIDADNLREYLIRLIDQLPSRRREIFILSREEGLTYKEIAQRLNLSEKTVEHQISEALKFLKKNLYMLLLFI